MKYPAHPAYPFAFRQSALGAGIPATAAMQQLVDAAAPAVRNAVEGKRIASASQSPAYEAMRQPAGSNLDAAIKAAYWMAVSAQLVGSKSLAGRAAMLYATTRGKVIIPGSGILWADRTGDVMSTLNEAAAAIQASAGGNSEVLTIAQWLRTWATPAYITGRQQTLVRDDPTVNPMVAFQQMLDRYKWWVGGGLLAMGLLTLVTVKSAVSARSRR